MQDKSCDILDCTLRDGGYYTEWDFDESLLDIYLEAMNKLPINFIEIGYRSVFKQKYAGAHFYLPEYLIDKIKSKTKKDLSVILNEKDVRLEDLEGLLKVCSGKIKLIRLAVAPVNFERGIKLAKKIKKMGFQVAFNLMYASKWESNYPEKSQLFTLNSTCDYFNIVDSYGALFPEDIRKIFKHLNEHLTITIGFHGHNNLEMALINSLEAIKCGAKIIDTTIDGMGRGAGNLKTELLLSVLYRRKQMSVDFDILNEARKAFLELKKEYNWGTSLPYMVSGSFSLPQDKVKAQVEKRYFSLNKIIENLIESPADENFFADFETFNPSFFNAEVLIVGGGELVKKHQEGLKEYLLDNPYVPVIYASSKNAGIFLELKNPQIHLIPGREFQRLKKEVPKKMLRERTLILTPTTQVLDDLKKLLSFKLPAQEKNIFPNSVTEYCLKVAQKLKVKRLRLTGYDGYGKFIRKGQQELFGENEMLFKEYGREMEIESITPSEYTVKNISVYSILT